MTTNSFEDLVLEKLEVIENRVTGIEKQINLLLNIFSRFGQRLTDVEKTCVEHHIIVPVDDD